MLFKKRKIKYKDKQCFGNVQIKKARLVRPGFRARVWGFLFQPRRNAKGLLNIYAIFQID